MQLLYQQFNGCRLKSFVNLFTYSNDFTSVRCVWYYNLIFHGSFCLSAAVRKVFLQSRLFLKGYKVKWHEYLVSCLCVIGILSLSTVALYQVVGLLTIATIYALSSLTETHRV